MERAAALRARCRAVVGDAPVLSHPFFDVIESGGPEGRATLRRWSQDDYWIARAFPAVLGSLIAIVDHVEARHILVRNLWEESGRGRLDLAHFALYKAFLASIGVQVPDEHRPHAEEFLDVQVELAKRDPVLGVAAFCYASEYLCLFEFEPITRAVALHFPSADGRYLREISMDVRHTAELEKALDLMLGEDYQGERNLEIEDALRTALDARCRFYDRVMSQI